MAQKKTKSPTRAPATQTTTAAAPTLTFSPKDLALSALTDYLDIQHSLLKCKLDKACSTLEPTLELPTPKSTLTGRYTCAAYIIEAIAKKPALLGVSDVDKAEVQQWSTTATTAPTTPKEQADMIKSLDAHLATRTYLVSNYFTLADVFMYAAIYYPVAKMTFAQRVEVPNVTRFFDLVQHTCFDGVVAVGTAERKSKVIDIELNAPVVVKEKQKGEGKDEKGAKGKEEKGAKGKVDGKGAAEKKEEKKGNDKKEKKEKAKEAAAAKQEKPKEATDGKKPAQEKKKEKAGK
ncbi:Eukaryotic translation elongation factor 1 epsilon-1, partial [Quaeritorhiza haematococci]